MKKDRIENAIRHIQTATDVDPWAAELAVEALKAQLSEEDTTSDCISRQAAIDALDKIFDSIPMEQTTEILTFRRTLRELPSVQPDIIRCRECKWKQGSECTRFAEVRPFPDDFCSRAERRTNGKTISK